MPTFEQEVRKILEELDKKIETHGIRKACEKELEKLYEKHVEARSIPAFCRVESHEAESLIDKYLKSNPPGITYNHSGCRKYIEINLTHNFNNSIVELGDIVIWGRYTDKHYNLRGFWDKVFGESEFTETNAEAVMRNGLTLKGNCFAYYGSDSSSDSEIHHLVLFPLYFRSISNGYYLREFAKANDTIVAEILRKKIAFVEGVIKKYARDTRSAARFRDISDRIRKL